MKQRCYGVNPTLSTISTTSFSYSTTDIKDEAKKTMKEDKQKPDTKQLDSTQTPKTASSAATPKNASTQPLSKPPVSKLSLIAILLTIGLGGFMYYHGHQQATLQNETINHLQTEIVNIKQTLKQSVSDDLQNKITDSVNQQNQQLSSFEHRIESTLAEQQTNQQKLTNQVNDSIKLTQQNIHSLNERLSALSTSENTIWLISQSNYLVHLAGRKIWNDQDYTTARLLLKSADESLAQANDPSLLPARQAINKDIASLEQITTVDADGIIMNLMGLSDALTQLPLVGQKHKDNQDSTINENHQALSSTESQQNQHANSDQPLSSSVEDWSDNLVKSAESFLDKFIRVEKIEKNDSFTQCLSQAGQDEKQMVKCQILKNPISLEQTLYLRENIRFRLLIAAQAVPRHQELIYQRALKDASTWVSAYFDGKDASVNAFLSDLDKLTQQKIATQNVPEKLASNSELEKLMQTRVRLMLTK